jgi:prolyl-tRNA editing enzyme YbaK/EbsC (Cys-tRNA(Pro) deacylase)
MMAALPEPVERVSAFLRDAGAEARIEEFPDGTLTAEDAAAAVGCELGQIVKSMVLVCDDEPVVALVPGDRRCDLEKAAHAAGAKSARTARRKEVEDTTGFPAGGVAPFPLPKVRAVLLDRGLLRHSVVWAGAGSPKHVMGLSPVELGRLARARTVDVVEDDPYHSSGHSSGHLPGRSPRDPVADPERETPDQDDSKER